MELKIEDVNKIIKKVTNSFDDIRGSYVSSWDDEVHLSYRNLIYRDLANAKDDLVKCYRDLSNLQSDVARIKDSRHFDEVISSLKRELGGITI